MVHLVDCLGVGPLRLILEAIRNLAGLPNGVIVLDPADRTRLVEVIRPAVAPGEPVMRPFCTYLRGDVPGGELLCEDADLCGGWHLCDNRCVEAVPCRCHMQIYEIGMVLELAGDLSDPIVIGQALTPGDEALVEERIQSIPNRLEELADKLEQQAKDFENRDPPRPDRAKELMCRSKEARKKAKEVAPEHLQKLRELLPTLTVMSQEELQARCTRLTAGVRPIGELAEIRVQLGLTLHRAKAGLQMAAGR